MNTLSSSRCSRTYQYGGATLLFVLIMLLVVSIIGVAAARSTLMQERMAANTNVRNVVFEAAESALAAGEIRVANTPEIWKIAEKADDKVGCSDGVCRRNTSTSPIWTNTAWTTPEQHKKMKAIESGPIKVEPKYVIEDLGQTMASCDPDHIDITKSADCPYTSAQRYFRVVSFAKAYETQVMLQSTYLDPNPTRENPTPALKWTAERPKCNGTSYLPAEKTCCPPDKEHDNKEWLINASKTCPSYCQVKPGTYQSYDPNSQQCCDPNPSDNTRSVIASTEKCPAYCGNQVIDESKEVCCNVQGKWSVYPGTNPNVDCPQFCGNDPRGQDQVCCWKGGEQYSYTASSTNDCPKFCDVGGTQTAVLPGQRCCDNASRTGKEIVNGECPTYCDGKVLQSGQTCCSVPNGHRIVNGGQANCPKFCGSNEYFPPSQECCGRGAGAKIYNPTTQQCCLGSNNATAIIGINEHCCADQHGNQVANPTSECPIWCGAGDNAIRIYAGEECCKTYGTPVKASATQICCSGAAVPKTASGQCPETCNGQSYDPGSQVCCYDYDANGNLREHSPADRGKCPNYCKAPGSTGHNKPLPSGEVCCTDPTADNYGDPGRCIGGTGGGAGT